MVIGWKLYPKIGIIICMENKELQSTTFNGLRFVILTSIVTAIINVILILPGSYAEIIYGALQFIWTLFAIILLLRIYYTSLDKNVRYVARFFSIALAPWTITLILWKIMLPMFYNDNLAYYVSGFGYLATYGILIYILFKVKNSKNWHLAKSKDLSISILGAITIIGILLTVLWYLQWDSPRLVDITILLIYLIADVTILALVIKLINMDLENNLKYLILIIGGFIFISFMGDLLFEIRWLFSVHYILSYKISFIINVIYNISLVFLTIALILYNIKTKNRSLDKINRMLDDTKLFASDIIKNSPDAMCICDKNGNLVTSNDLFTRMFSHVMPKDTGALNLFTHLMILEEFKSQFTGLKRGNIIVIPQANGCLITNSVQPLYVNLKVFPTFGSDGKISNYVVIFGDITDNVLTNDTLKAAKNQAELYVDLMGHDINNMNQIAYGYLELALDKLENNGKLDKADQLLISRPVESLKNITNLISNVRKIQRERSGAYKLEIVDVGKMIEAVIDQYSNILRGDVVINYVPETQCFVIANELLNDAFINLVGNAIKHSSGPLTIDIKMSKVVDHDNNYCGIIVQDNGPGIPDDLKSTLFERLNLTESRARGKGFGLCLIKMLIDDYNGEFWVEDRVEGDYSKGAKFIIMLPAVEK